MTDAAATRPTTRRISFWAVGALICSLLPLCPPMGLVLAIVALIEIRRRPGMFGRPIAYVALVTSAVLTTTALILGAWWNAHIRQPMIAGPDEEIRAGMNGDVEAFWSAFMNESDRPDMAEADAFLTTLVFRYGRLLSVEQRATEEVIAVDDLDRVRQRIPYSLEFEQDRVDADAEFVIWDHEASWRPVGRWESITIFDAALGDLSYPPAAVDKEFDGEA